MSLLGPSERVRQLFRQAISNTIASEGEPAALGKSSTGPVYFTDDNSVEHKDRVWFRKGANKEVVGVAHAKNMGLPDVPDLPIRVARRFGQDWVVDYDRNDPAADSSHSHDSATRNVFTGSGAATVGTDNTVMGNSAGDAVTTGATDNVLIGSFAAGTMTTADRNVYIGNNAGPISNTGTGADNVAVGNLAGWSLGSGARNTILGSSAGENYSSGVDNTIVGFEAGGGNSDENTIVGYQAGNSNGSDGNTNLGYRAGNGSSGTYNVCIGHRAGISQASGNELYIDANPSAPADPLIHGEFDNDNLGFCRRGAGDYGSGAGVIAIGNATTVPTTNPTGGGILYVTGGALTYRGSSGTVTTIANA